MRNIWNIKIKPTKISKNLNRDPILGKFSKKLLNKEQRNISMEYNKFIMT